MKIHVHALCMAEMEITIGFWRETGADNAAVDRCMFGKQLRRVQGPFELAALEGAGCDGSSSSNTVGGVATHWCRAMLVWLQSVAIILQSF